MCIDIYAHVYDIVSCVPCAQTISTLLGPRGRCSTNADSRWCPAMCCGVARCQSAHVFLDRGKPASVTEQCDRIVTEIAPAASAWEINDNQMKQPL